ncbi:uncharacterized protein BDV14DRAFT_10622 [Aspergillus stella-maris]|uniref:uncharacterized protein n=1 Tax=Aspergillus stella-maris TaxID=1810926 RepID=UPI003CCCB2C5
MSLKTIKVAIAGGTGLVGKLIIDGLQRSTLATFQITILSRTPVIPSATSASSISSLHSPVQTIQVDYTNHPLLVSSLGGQDVVISAVHHSASVEVIDHALLTAALKAGVKRFIPNDHNWDITHPSVRDTAASVLERRWEFQGRLEDVARAGQIEWVVVSPSQFLDDDYAMEWLGFDIRARKATLYDGGRNKATGCSIGFLGDVYALVLVDWMDGNGLGVINQRTRVAEAEYTGLEILGLFEEIMGEKWSVVEDVSSAESLRRSAEAEGKEGLRKSFLAHVLRLNYDGSGAAHLADGLSWGGNRLRRRSLRDIVAATVAAKQ